MQGCTAAELVRTYIVGLVLARLLPSHLHLSLPLLHYIVHGYDCSFFLLFSVSDFLCISIFFSFPFFSLCSCSHAYCIFLFFLFVSFSFYLFSFLSICTNSCPFLFFHPSLPFPTQGSNILRRLLCSASVPE